MYHVWADCTDSVGQSSVLVHSVHSEDLLSTISSYIDWTPNDTQLPSDTIPSSTVWLAYSYNMEWYICALIILHPGLPVATSGVQVYCWIDPGLPVYQLRGTDLCSVERLFTIMILDQGFIHW